MVWMTLRSRMQEKPFQYRAGILHEAEKHLKLQSPDAEKAMCFRLQTLYFLPLLNYMPSFTTTRLLATPDERGFIEQYRCNSVTVLVIGLAFGRSICPFELMPSDNIILA